MAYFGSIFFANMGGGGGQNYFHKFQIVAPNLERVNGRGRFRGQTAGGHSKAFLSPS